MKKVTIHKKNGLYFGQGVITKEIINDEEGTSFAHIQCEGKTHVYARLSKILYVCLFYGLEARLEQ